MDTVTHGTFNCDNEHKLTDLYEIHNDKSETPYKVDMNFVQCSFAWKAFIN